MISICVSAYNNPRALGLCLKSLTNQTVADFRVYVAEDGEDPDIQTKIAEFTGELTIEHVRHADEGYRKAVINNEVFRRIPKGLLICVDGDTFLHHRFVEDHVLAHDEQPGGMFMGRRVECGPEFSEALTEERIPTLNHGLSWDLLTSDSDNVFRALRVGPSWLRGLLKRNRVPDLLGSNFSLPIDLMKRVNGYNEDYQAYWGEDGDLFVRIRNLGVPLHGAKGFAIQYHIYHERREPSQEHQAKYQALLQDHNYVRCESGMVRPG